MNTIVCLVDFSDAAAEVLEKTDAFSQAFHAGVILLHVVPKEHVILDLGMVAPMISQAPGPEAIQTDFERLSSLAQTHLKSGIASRLEQLQEASVQTVLEKCEQLGADLIVVGSHRHSALYNWLVGSMTSGVLKSARFLVLVVPAHRD